MPILGIIASSFRSAAGPEGAYDALATVTLSASTASITFSGIPSGYKHLQIRALGRNSTSSNPVFLQYNGDTTTSNYHAHLLYGTGTAAFSVAESSTYSQYIGYFPDSGKTANVFGAAVIDVLDYQNTNKNKTTRSLCGWDANGSGFSWFQSQLWMNTSAITSITLKPYSGDFVTYSSFALYGVK